MAAGKPDKRPIAVIGTGSIGVARALMGIARAKRRLPLFVPGAL